MEAKKEILGLQRVLDTRVCEEHGLNPKARVENLVLALTVELGELANETRCFKDWSVKPPSEREVILEEFVDGIHFINGLGIVLEREEDLLGAKVEFKHVHISLVEQFNEVYSAIASMRWVLQNSKWRDVGQELKKVYEGYFLLGQLFGFTFDEIYSAYMKKNEKNHERQNNGY
ncbi:dUTP diphosphatase [Bacillus thuringiensis]|uniref:dUTP diphosphatase n=1 Tax=Bacillus thuringiensis TaxID=1428 RepID=UPI000BFD4D05|nr:dUTP diphosphatase [Bacillus thuringiensis]PGT90158.1 dUTPase [Bacillus thuringiensis]